MAEELSPTSRGMLQPQHSKDKQTAKGRKRANHGTSNTLATPPKHTQEFFDRLCSSLWSQLRHKVRPFKEAVQVIALWVRPATRRQLSMYPQRAPSAASRRGRRQRAKQRVAMDCPSVASTLPLKRPQAAEEAPEQTPAQPQQSLTSHRQDGNRAQAMAHNRNGTAAAQETTPTQKAANSSQTYTESLPTSGIG
ncbi:Hypothetical predicted protein [Pelobates cultripes]|uniref:Uncharacterized protein n=1 Tax=Pelobates cultripes TaxID=61616 RepID=A0AAD1SK34_PELCU|nr:Hypothetical predicted protein [Pelobates cultripes]